MAVTKKVSNGKPTARPVVVTTKHRGVFFGYATDTSGPHCTLERARMCVYWSSAMHGVLGLASQGPDNACRVGPKVASIDVRDVTAVVEVTEEAVTRWEAAPWK